MPTSSMKPGRTALLSATAAVPAGASGVTGGTCTGTDCSLAAGQGTATSMPSPDAGSCFGGSCTTAPGTGVITLTASPVLTYVFTGWSGEGCPAGPNPLVITAPTEDISCTALFGFLPPT